MRPINTTAVVSYKDCGDDEICDNGDDTGNNNNDGSANRNGSAATPGKAAGSNYFFVTTADRDDIPVFEGTAALTGDYNHISYIAVNASGASDTGLWRINGAEYCVLEI
ncbi:MAG: hypothetical protein ACMUJM_21810 [bacterium]